MMEFDTTKLIKVILLSTAGILVACTKDYFPVPPEPVPPIPPKNTITLEATWVANPPNSISDPYWTSTDFHSINAADLNTQNLYTDGLMNMTGTFDGVTDFNYGEESEIIMKAAYDDEDLYMLLEWSDATMDLSHSTWLFDGPEDPLKSDDPDGWTSQKNNDRIALSFEIEAASSGAGSFSEVGCSASCHNNEMKPEIGKVDIWSWSLAFSDPFGLAGDMVTDGTSGLSFDSGQMMYERNNSGDTDRSGPAFEWDGEVQEITRADGSPAILDPAYYLLNKIAFTGDPVVGKTSYHHDVKGCFHCHGDNGTGGGDFGDGPSFTRPQVNRYSRENFDEYAGTLEHSGFSYWDQNNDTERENIIAYIRGLSGVPGHNLQTPDGSNIDIISKSSENLAFVNSTSEHGKYKVLLVRSLNTGNDDDVLFDLEQNMEYVFGIALMDNDGINHIGSLKETLTFKEK
jgi:hypothetical protein